LTSINSAPRWKADYNEEKSNVLAGSSLLPDS
jgi:hypothetical protein